MPSRAPSRRRPSSRSSISPNATPPPAPPSRRPENAGIVPSGRGRIRCRWHKPFTRFVPCSATPPAQRWYASGGEFGHRRDDSGHAGQPLAFVLPDPLHHHALIGSHLHQRCVLLDPANQPVGPSELVLVEA